MMEQVIVTEIAANGDHAAASIWNSGGDHHLLSIIVILDSDIRHVVVMRRLSLLACKRCNTLLAPSQ